MNYRGKCPLCSEACGSENGPQSAILAHVASVHMTPDVVGYLLESLKMMGEQWWRIGMAEGAKRKPRRRKAVVPA